MEENGKQTHKEVPKKYKHTLHFLQPYSEKKLLEPKWPSD